MQMLTRWAAGLAAGALLRGSPGLGGGTDVWL